MRQETYAGSWAAPPTSGTRRRTVLEYLEACNLENHLNFVAMDVDNYSAALQAHPDIFVEVHDDWIVQDADGFPSTLEFPISLEDFVPPKWSVPWRSGGVLVHD